MCMICTAGRHNLFIACFLFSSMLLKSIELNNIRSYTTQKIFFPKSSILLSGDIGSGKSTILLAAEFALFGLMRGSLSGESLLRKGKHEGYVVLHITIDGRDVVIRRALKRRDTVTQDAGHIIIDGVKTEGTASELKSKILDLLGYPESLLTKSKALIYRYTVYTPQEEMKHILLEDKETRLDTLRKVFGIDKYKRIVENAGTYCRILRERKRMLLVSSEGLEAKEKQCGVYTDEKHQLGRDLSFIDDELVHIRKNIAAKKDEVAAAEKNAQRVMELRSQLKVLDEKVLSKADQRQKNSKAKEQLIMQIEQTKKEVDHVEVEDTILPDQAEVEAHLRKKEAELQEIVLKKSNLSEQQRSIKVRMDDLHIAITATKEKLEGKDQKGTALAELEQTLPKKGDLINTIAPHEENIAKFRAVLKTYEMRRAEAEKLKQRIRELSECPTCLQEVGDEHKQTILITENQKIDADHQEFETCKHNLEKSMATVAELRTEIETIEKKEQMINALRVELKLLDGLEEDLTKQGSQITRLESVKIKTADAIAALDGINLEEIRIRIEECRAMLKRIQNNNLKLQQRLQLRRSIQEKEQSILDIENEQDAYKEDIKAFNKEKLKINETLDTLKDSDQRFKMEREAFQKIQDNEKKLEIQAAEKRKEIAGIANLITSLTQELEGKRTARKQLMKVGELSNWLEEHFIKLMYTMEKQVMMNVYAEFNAAFTHWFSMIVDDEVLSSQLDDRFTPVITQNGYETDINHLSGGEKTAVALAYRLALNKVINNFISTIKTRDLIILDEPTDGFSTEQLDKVRDVLSELECDQVILVSHEAKIESFVDHVIRVRKDEHTSRATAE